jgi:hypothetical protein
VRSRITQENRPESTIKPEGCGDVSSELNEQWVSAGQRLLCEARRDEGIGGTFRRKRLSVARIC